MENSPANVGFSEVPPEKGGGIDSPGREEKPFPPPDRPVYAVPNSEEEHSLREGRSRPFLIVLVGLLAVAGILFAATYFYKPDLRAVMESVRPAPAVGGLERTALKLEVARTLQILNEISTEFSNEPEKLKKVEELKKETMEILNSLGVKPR